MSYHLRSSKCFWRFSWKLRLNSQQSPLAPSFGVESPRYLIHRSSRTPCWRVLVTVLGRSRRWTKPPLLPTSSGSSFPGSGPQCDHQSRPCGFGNVNGGLYTTKAEQEGDANRELWLWLRICIRNGPRPLLLRQMNRGLDLADKRGKSNTRSPGPVRRVDVIRRGRIKEPGRQPA